MPVSKKKKVKNRWKMLSAIAGALLSSERRETCGCAADTIISLDCWCQEYQGSLTQFCSAPSWSPRLSGVYGNFQQLQTQASFILVRVCH